MDRTSARESPSRNQACPCGSGRKFKHCCGRSTKRETGAARQALTAGDNAAAERLCRAALRREPDDTDTLLLLGRLRYERGDAEEAAALFARAARITSSNDAAYNNLAAALIALGRLPAAREALEIAIGLNPRNAMAWMNLGNLARDAGQNDRAIAHYLRARDADPSAALVRFNLAIALRDTGALNEALGELGNAVAIDGRFLAALQAYAETLPLVARAAWPTDVAERIEQCLCTSGVEPSAIAEPALELLRESREFATLEAAAAAGDSTLERFIALPEGRSVLTRPLFLALLQHTLVADADFDTLVTQLRRAWWRQWCDGRRGDSPPSWAMALARYCDLAEFVFDESPDEQAWLDSTEGQAAAPVLACYRPTDYLAAVATERAAVKTLAAAMPALTPLHDATSQAVRQLYEENPYPRWRALPAPGAPRSLAERVAALFPWLGESLASIPAKPRILVAGCGTGLHAALVALAHPHSHVLAIDLSRTSLGFAAYRSRELGIGNIEFAQADLLELDALGQQFDLIESAGVLHHLADPAAGLHALLRRLAPGGYLRLGLYSDAARRGVVAAQALIAARGFEPTPAGIKSCRRAILALPDDAPARAVTHSLDFYSASGCRDLLFHVCEHRYTIPQLTQLLDDLELEFMGFEFADATVLARYRERYPDDPTARSLADWTDYEAQMPDTFAAMYQFWVRPRPRSDATADGS
jgi:SAM-dependent methyltransferase/Tfp pilus assembly protein PilF